MRDGGETYDDVRVQEAAARVREQEIDVQLWLAGLGHPFLGRSFLHLRQLLRRLADALGATGGERGGLLRCCLTFRCGLLSIGGGLWGHRRGIRG